MKKKFHPYGKLSIAEEKLKEKNIGAFILASDYMTKYTSSESKLFWIFPSIEEFLEYQKTIEDPHFYEVIFGDRPHKLYFDIDSHENIDDNILDFVDYLKSLDKNDDYNVYISHRKNYYSYHIISKNSFFNNNVEMKEYANLILNKYIDKYDDELFLRYVDIKGVYKKIQQLRLLGSSKINLNNTKIFWFGYDSSFEASLVQINIDFDEDDENIINKNIINEKNIDKNIIDEKYIDKIIDNKNYIEFVNDTYTVIELKEYCKKNNISGYSKYRKAELINYINDFLNK